MVGIREFELAEGVDRSGVTTKMLTCNCTINLLIHNKSKLFGLHIPPPIIQMAFGRLPLALTHVSKHWFGLINFDNLWLTRECVCVYVCVIVGSRAICRQWVHAIWIVCGNKKQANVWRWKKHGRHAWVWQRIASTDSFELHFEFQSSLEPG